VEKFPEIGRLRDEEMRSDRIIEIREVKRGNVRL
jgi:hypothetical protein